MYLSEEADNLKSYLPLNEALNLPSKATVKKVAKLVRDALRDDSRGYVRRGVASHQVLKNGTLSQNVRKRARPKKFKTVFAPVGAGRKRVPVKFRDYHMKKVQALSKQGIDGATELAGSAHPIRGVELHGANINDRLLTHRARRHIDTLSTHELVHVNDADIYHKALRRNPKYAKETNHALQDRYARTSAPYASRDPEVVKKGLKKAARKFMTKQDRAVMRTAQEFRKTKTPSEIAAVSDFLKYADDLALDARLLSTQQTPGEVNATVGSLVRHYPRLVKDLKRNPTVREILTYAGNDYKVHALDWNPRALQHFVKRMHREGMPVRP